MRISKKVQFLDRIHLALLVLEVISKSVNVVAQKPDCETAQVPTNDMNLLPSTEDLLIQLSSAPKVPDHGCRRVRANRTTMLILGARTANQTRQ
jgi:hypothetical protein